MKLGYSKNLEMEDLWNLKRTDSAAFNSEMFQRAWSDELSKKKPSFVGAICRTYGLVFASAAIFKISQDMLSFTQPQLLSRLVRLINWKVG